MINKTNYMSKANEISEIAKKYNGVDKILKNVDDYVKEMDYFSLKILFVGGFSAGKSALINTMLDRDLLLEDQKPETAIASEITYDHIEYVELIDNEGMTTKCDLEEIEDLDTTKYSFLKYHINNEWLSKFKNFSFVDMPGFNSGIEHHNKALMNYVGQGNAYVLVIDCEDGEIKTSVIDFMKEIKQYDNNLSIVVSKADKKPDSHIETIVEKISNTASNILDKNVNVIKASKYDNDNKDIDAMIEAFDDQDIFEQKFKSQISEIGNLCYVALESVSKTADYDDSEIEKEIKQREKSKEKLSNQLIKERKKLSVKMKNQVKPSILSDVQNVLYMNSTQLVSAVMAGGDNFTRTVNNILRPVLITSTKKYTEESFFEFVEQMDLSDVLLEDSAEDITNNISSKYIEASSKINKIISNSNKSNGAYKTILGALAITTSVVAPWIELIIVFLPDIIKLFGKLNQSSQIDSLKRKVENEVIPQIVSKMAVEIDKSLKILESEIVEEIEEKVGDLLDVEAEALDAALKMKSKKKNEYDQLLIDVQNDMVRIDSIINEL